MKTYAQAMAPISSKPAVTRESSARAPIPISGSMVGAGVLLTDVGEVGELEGATVGGAEAVGAVGDLVLASQLEGSTQASLLAPSGVYGSASPLEY